MLRSWKWPYSLISSFHKFMPDFVVFGHVICGNKTVADSSALLKCMASTWKWNTILNWLMEVVCARVLTLESSTPASVLFFVRTNFPFRGIIVLCVCVFVCWKQPTYEIRCWKVLSMHNKKPNYHQNFFFSFMCFMCVHAISERERVVVWVCNNY